MAKQSTPPVWRDSLSTQQCVPLTGDLACDVCVIGAGIAGLTTAYELALSGKQVVVVDPNPSAGGGETRFTTAHLASAIDDRFQEVIRIRGKHMAQLAYQSHAAAIDRIEAICQAESISCGFRRSNGYLFPAPGDAKLIESEFEAATSAGCPVELQETLPISDFGDGPCLRFSNQATFEPSRYLDGLFAAAKRHGAKFYGKSRATEVTGGSPAIVRTEQGGTIRATAVVVATNTPIHTRVTMHTKLAAFSTYAIAGPIPRGSIPDALYWDTLDPYHYIRLVTSLDRDDLEPDTDLLIVGGADHKTGQESDPARRWDDLENWARERFPQFKKVTHFWSGMVMETLDGLAYIGADPSGEKNVYLVTGDSGMGMTHGTIAGQLLRDLILDRPNPWTELYDPARLPFRSTGEYISDGANVAMQYTDWLTSGDVRSEKDIERGEGAVVRHGLSKLAVYCETDGKMHSMSAVCPHLGGLVRWNSAEKTWDCPCHGSRFEAKGAVIHGPANTGLSLLEAKS